MNVCDKNYDKKIIKSTSGVRQYIVNQIQIKQQFKTTLQQDEYNLQMEQYIQDIVNLQKNNPNKSLYKIVNDYIRNI